MWISSQINLSQSSSIAGNSTIAAGQENIRGSIKGHAACSMISNVSCGTSSPKFSSGWMGRRTLGLLTRSVALGWFARRASTGRSRAHAFCIICSACQVSKCLTLSTTQNQSGQNAVFAMVDVGSAARTIVRRKPRCAGASRCGKRFMPTEVLFSELCCKKCKPTVISIMKITGHEIAGLTEDVATQSTTT